MKVEIDKFGKSHWGLLLYIETRCVDYKGKLDFSQMRINGERHPGLDVNRIRGKFPSHLKGGEKLENHDDWDCAEDLEASVLVKIDGTGINPILKMTALGWETVGRLRAFKAEGGQCADFVFKRR